MSRTLTDVALYAKGSPCPLPFLSLVQMFKSTKVGSYMQLRNSAHPEVVHNIIPSNTGVKWKLCHQKSAPICKGLSVDEGAVREIEQRLECKEVVGKVAQGRMGVEFAGGKEGNPHAPKTSRQQYSYIVAEESE